MVAPLLQPGLPPVESVGPRLTAVQNDEERHQLPEFDVDIKDLKQFSEKTRCPEGIGCIATYSALMKDGSAYKIRDIYPLEEYDATVDMTTPLGTELDGHNTHIGIRFGQAGNRTRIFSFNLAADHPTSLAHDAFVYTLLMRALDARAGLYPGERPSINYGQSRGGMGGIGIMAYANQIGLDVIAGIHIDKCLPKKTDAQMTFKGLPPQNIAGELLALPKLLHRGKDEPLPAYIRRLKHLPKTVSFTPSSLLAQLHSGQALWTGEAGTFTEHLSPAQILIAHNFNRNRLNGNKDYREQMAHLPLFREVNEHYWHLDLARPEVTEGSTAKIVTLQQAYQQGEDLNAIADILTAPLLPLAA